MEGLVKGIFNAALDAATDYLEGKKKDEGEASGIDRATWAEVAAGNQEESSHLDEKRRPSKSHHGDEDEQETWSRRRPSKAGHVGPETEEDNVWGRRPSKADHVEPENEDENAWHQVRPSKGQKQQYRKNAGEQNYSKMAEVDTAPTEEELCDYTKACSRLWDLDLNRLTPGEDYEINCGRGKKTYNKSDMAGNSLFQFVSEGVFRRPTYARFYALLDNYHADQGVSEHFSSRQEQEQVAFIEEISRTGPIQYLRKYLSAKQLVRESEFKECLNRLWFDLYKRDNTRNSSSAFEHVFVGEVKGDEAVSGLHNWIQFYVEEAKGSLDYQGYIIPRRHGSDLPDSQSQLITVQFTWNGARKPESSTFIGVSPEFEFALYTLCFFCGQEDNHVAIGPYSVNIKCYGYGRNQLGSVYPIAMD